MPREVVANIREYRTADYDAGRGLWVQLTEQHRQIYNDPSIGGDDPGSGLDDYLSNPNRRISWVAEIEGLVTGMTGLIVHGDEAEVEPIIVARQLRSGGIGHALISRTISEAKNLGIRFLSAQPVVRNVTAVSFFINNGFNIAGHIDLFQDLQPKRGRTWKSWIKLHGRKLRY